MFWKIVSLIPASCYLISHMPASQWSSFSSRRQCLHGNDLKTLSSPLMYRCLKRFEKNFPYLSFCPEQTVAQVPGASYLLFGLNGRCQLTEWQPVSDPRPRWLPVASSSCCSARWDLWRALRYHGDHLLQKPGKEEGCQWCKAQEQRTTAGKRRPELDRFAFFLWPILATQPPLGSMRTRFSKRRRFHLVSGFYMSLVVTGINF